jgi:hypothetical protein
MEYLMNASHMSLAIPDMKMHANEINLAEARRLCAEIMPRGWTREDEQMVWFEMKSDISKKKFGPNLKLLCFFLLFLLYIKLYQLTS